MRRVEEIRDLIATELATIDASTAPVVGESNFRTTIKNVYKFSKTCLEENNFPSLCLIRSTEELQIRDPSTFQKIYSVVQFEAIGLVSGTADTVTGLPDVVDNAEALIHDIMRVLFKISVEHAGDTEGWMFAVKPETGGQPIRITPLISFEKHTRGEFAISFRVQVKNQDRQF